MKVAVTAANGNLGRTIVKEMVKEMGSDRVLGIARTPEKASDLGVEIRRGDYNKYEDFRYGLQGVDRIVLISGMDKPEKRVEQHRNIIRAAEENGVEKIVYTSIMGDPCNTAFDDIIKSNRQTERDIASASVDWAIGRNALYLEPDVEYLDRYKKAGYVWNCAGDGRCSYTSRPTLAKAYTRLVLDDSLDKKIYNLGSTPITQTALAQLFNKIYGTNLTYQYFTPEEYQMDRTEELGPFLGTVISGIYEGISKGMFDILSDYEKVTGSKHPLAKEIMESIAGA